MSAARVLRSSYCSLAHGKVLAERFLGPERTIALATGAVNALDPMDAEIVRFATLVTREPASVTAQDVERLRALGLSDEEILDVVLAGARCFFSTVLGPWASRPSGLPGARPQAAGGPDRGAPHRGG